MYDGVIYNMMGAPRCCKGKKDTVRGEKKRKKEKMNEKKPKRVLSGKTTNARAGGNNTV